MKRMSSQELRALEALVSNDPRKALETLRHYENEYPGDVNLVANRGGLLINIGTALQDRSVVERGIASLEELRESDTYDFGARLYYHLANGYSVIHDLERKEAGTDFKFEPDETPLLNAKKNYLLAISQKQQLDPYVQAQLRVNYGNCLSGLGRTLEAVAQYDAAIHDYPEHRMAWGNLGIAVEYLARLSRHVPLLHDAAHFLKKALQIDEPIRVGEDLAVVDFRHALLQVEARLANRKHTHISTTDDGGPSPSTRSYRRFCEQHLLFLNLNLNHCQQVHPWRDCFGFSLVTPLHDDTTFPRVARALNEIKERFAAARLLLFEACSEHWASEEIDSLTEYVDCLDYAVYGVRVAKLKMAFEAAYNVLDKVALLLNRYLKLRNNEKGIDFRHVLRRAEGAHERILELQNPHLFGLYDLGRDLQKDEGLHHFTDLRNRSTHRYLVPHVETLRWPEDEREQGYHIDYGAFFERTLELMRLVRSAVVYLILFIDTEERKKKKRLEGTIAPMPFCRFTPYPYGPSPHTWR